MEEFGRQPDSSLAWRERGNTFTSTQTRRRFLSYTGRSEGGERDRIAAWKGNQPPLKRFWTFYENITVKKEPFLPYGGYF